ncbi:cytochrome b/b6 domain-containing protein [Streptomyces sp. NPDC001020]
MNPRRSHRSLPKPGRSAYGVATVVVLPLIPVIVLAGGNAVRDFLNYGAGVLSLVALSCSVIWGLIATDRLFLGTRQRIVAQAVHRATAVSSAAFLLLHITVKLALDHTRPIAALIPFSLGVTGSAGLIGLGSAAALLMIFTALTGALRSAFASPAPIAAHWRAMHMLAYPAWCCALIHGLYAGRQAKPTIVIMYSLCLIAVLGALALRSAPHPFKRKLADRIAALLDAENRKGRKGLAASRARSSEAVLAGFTARPEGRGDAIAVGRIPPQPSASRYEASPAPTMSPRMVPPPGVRPTEAMQRAGGGSADRPIPSPPIGAAPPTGYDSLQSTGYGIPAYGSPGQGEYGVSETYATGETNAPYGTYVSNNTYNTGPATETLPGAFGTPRAGEPWNAPSGGFE